MAPLRKEAQVRALAATHLLLPDSDIEDGAEEALDEVRDWLDLIALVRAEQDGINRVCDSKPPSLRNLYRDLFASVREIEARCHAVCLVGIYEAKSAEPAGTIFSVGAVALRSRDKNPAAAKLAIMWAEPTVAFSAIGWGLLESKNDRVGP
jgi:hypothetical protein